MRAEAPSLKLERTDGTPLRHGRAPYRQRRNPGVALEVKAAAADAAAALAEAVLTDRLKGLSADPLVDRAVGELAGKLQ